MFLRAWCYSWKEAVLWDLSHRLDRKWSLKGHPVLGFADFRLLAVDKTVWTLDCVNLVPAIYNRLSEPLDLLFLLLGMFIHLLDKYEFAGLLITGQPSASFICLILHYPSFQKGGARVTTVTCPYLCLFIFLLYEVDILAKISRLLQKDILIVWAPIAQGKLLPPRSLEPGPFDTDSCGDLHASEAASLEAGSRV